MSREQEGLFVCEMRYFRIFSNRKKLSSFPGMTSFTNFSSCWEHQKEVDVAFLFTLINSLLCGQFLGLSIHVYISANKAELWFFLFFVSLSKNEKMVSLSKAATAWGLTSKFIFIIQHERKESPGFAKLWFRRISSEHLHFSGLGGLRLSRCCNKFSRNPFNASDVI